MTLTEYHEPIVCWASQGAIDELVEDIANTIDASPVCRDAPSKTRPQPQHQEPTP